jgi:hypothetical protein
MSAQHTPSPSIPVSINEEDPLLQLGPLSMSLRQMITLALFIMLWVVLSRLVPFVPNRVGMLVALPVLMLGFVFAFMRKRGRPLDAYLGDLVAFRIEPREYLLRDSSRLRGSLEEEWDHE